MTSAGGMARAGRVKEKKKRRENRTRLIRRMRKAPFYGPQPSKCFGRRSRADLRSRCCLQLQRLRAAGLTPPAPLSPRERGEKDERELLLYPLLSPGERRGRGGEGRRRGDAEIEATAGSDTKFPDAGNPGVQGGCPALQTLILTLASRTPR